MPLIVAPPSELGRLTSQRYLEPELSAMFSFRKIA